MAGNTEDEDKTEEPTRRKLDEAHRKGDVPRSIEMSNFATIGGGALAAFVFAGSAGQELAGALRVYLGGAHQWRAEGAAFAAVSQHAALAAFGAVAVPLALVCVAALGGALAQHRPTWTVEPLTPKFERISPLAGAKRLFGKEAWVQLAKGLVKMGAVGAIVGALLWAERGRLPALVALESGALNATLLALSLKLLGAVAAAMAVIAAADLVYQRYQWLTRHRMSRHELKEEFKETEGQPEVKQRRRQLARERLRRRMMAQVPKATVVITNPTHYAVALRFEPGMPAPVCVAKGVDELALRIRAVATEARVPLVENPPLARALHATVEIDDEIPVEHYKAVAEVIGFVLRLSRRAA